MAFGRPLLASAGALLAVALLAGLGLHELQASPHSLGRTRVAAELQGARASLRRIGTHDELRISGMPQPPIGEIYEVWLSRPGARPQPTDALFNVTKSGLGAVEVPGSLRGVREVMVTSEPVGGSRQPTSPAVLSVNLAVDSSG